MSKYFYVYYSYEEFGRGYIGKRECKCLPEEDVKYFGTYRDRTFKPTQKIILEIFASREEVMDAEIKLHNFYEVHKNPHFANKSKATSTGFYVCMEGEDNPMTAMKGENSPFKGKKHTEESKKLISEKAKGRVAPNKGKPHSEETKQKIGGKKKTTVCIKKTSITVWR